MSVPGKPRHRTAPLVRIGVCILVGVLTAGCSPREYLESSGPETETQQTDPEQSEPIFVSEDDGGLDDDDRGEAAAGRGQAAARRGDAELLAADNRPANAPIPGPQPPSNPRQSAEPRNEIAELFRDPIPRDPSDRGDDQSRMGSTRDADPTVGGMVGGSSRLRTSGGQRLIDAGATADQFMQLISDADADTQTIVRRVDPADGGDSGASPAENREALLSVLRLKRDAAAELAIADDADAAQQIAGRRARLEAISGLASLGDREAVDLLRYAAAKESHSSVTPLAVDAHCVLVALGVQSLVAGNEDAVDDILAHVRSIDQLIDDADQLTTDAQVRDALSTLASLGAAREMLEKYGEEDAAAEIRQLILARFAGSNVPRVAAVASATAGEDRYRQIDRLLDQLLADQSSPTGPSTPSSQSVSIERWTESIESLIDVAPNIETVRYLAPAALELESFDQTAAAEAIYRVLTRRFTDPQAASTEQVDIAIAAANRRREMIGQVFQFSSRSLRGVPLRVGQFRGKILVMPFWVATSPESTAIIDELKAIESEFPDQVAVVGVNLDLTQRQVDEMDVEELPEIPSFAASAPSETVHPMARQFGMVSLPFVVVLDGDGVVSAFGYSGAAIRRQVQKLIRSDENE